MTLKEVTDEIASKGQKFQMDYGIQPFDVCLGPEEFQLLLENADGQATEEITPEWHYEMAPIFYRGMRVRRLTSPGILVGCLMAKDPRKFPLRNPLEGIQFVGGKE